MKQITILLVIAGALLIGACWMTGCAKATPEVVNYDKPTTVSISVDGEESLTVRIK